MYIKTNKEVKNKEDIRNIVTSVILRQKNPFCPNQIIEKVNGYLRYSEFYNKKELIQKLVDNAIDVFIRNGDIAIWNGILYPSDIDGFFIPGYYKVQEN